MSGPPTSTFGPGRHYVAAAMVGLVGTAVRIRYMPHHTEEVEVFDARTGAHRGTAELADRAPQQTREAVRRARDRRARCLRSDLAVAERARRARYAAVTTPEPAQRLEAVTVAEAERELREDRDTDLARRAPPDLIPLAPPAPGWVLPLDADNVHDRAQRKQGDP